MAGRAYSLNKTHPNANGGSNLEFSHEPVLLEECMDGLNIRPDGIYVDGTLGGGGHCALP